MKRLFSLLLVLIFTCCSLTAYTPVASALDDDEANLIEPYASDTISSYSAFLSSSGTTLIIHFSITGNEIMDEIGATKIVLEESTNKSSWTTVKTYYPTKYPNMLATNSGKRSSTVNYGGKKGRYYKAVVTLRAKLGSVSDSRTITTAVKQL